MAGAISMIGQAGAMTFGTAAQLTGAATGLVAHGMQNAGGYTQYWAARSQQHPGLIGSLNHSIGVGFTGLLQAIVGIGSIGTQVLGATAQGFAKMAS